MKNEQLEKLIRDLKAAKSDFWTAIAHDLDKPTRDRRIVNVNKIDKIAHENETIIIPGKVLGTGDLNKKVNVVAYQFSDEAYKKIKEKGDALTIQEFIIKNPTGKGVRIVG